MVLWLLVIGRHGRSREIGGRLGTPGGSRPWSRGSGRGGLGGGFGGLQLGFLARVRHGSGGRGFFAGATITRPRLFVLLGALAVGVLLVGLHVILVLLAARPSRTRRPPRVRLLVNRRIVDNVRMHGRDRVAFLRLPGTWRRIAGHNQRMGRLRVVLHLAMIMGAAEETTSGI